MLYVEGCPNWRRALATVGRLAGEFGIAEPVEARPVADGAAAERLRFLGSPTVRVDGRDVEPGAEGRTDYALACRLYRSGAGFSELPEERWLRAALAAAGRERTPEDATGRPSCG